jgi:hypothetical protein
MSTMACLSSVGSFAFPIVFGCVVRPFVIPPFSDVGIGIAQLRGPQVFVVRVLLEFLPTFNNPPSTETLSFCADMPREH